MIIELQTKNNAVIAEIKNVNGDIPRIGETINIKQHIEGHLETNDFMVIDVQYSLDDNKLTPVITCKEYATEQNRNDLLKSQGWI